jgi:hypothetical protein
MNVPLVSHLGIKEKDEKTLKLKCHNHVQNHIGTIHAAAQFALAETQSGHYLTSLFPQYKGKFLPLLRSSTVKYKNPASSDIYAEAFSTKVDLEKFKSQFIKKGRASISVEVKVIDTNGIVTMQGEFGWFIQKIDQ